ncbi:MAG: glycoside hydrolase family 13 protein [Gaiellaceae bacterium]
MSATEIATGLTEPHHDGSDLYVLERPSELGDEAVVRLRLPRAHSVDRVLLRYERDGEPRGVEATVDEETELDVWWRVAFPVWNPVTRYRWLLSGGDVGYAWVSALGMTPYEVTDADDFVVTAGPPAPPWHAESVAYQIFPDRFATSHLEVETPDWAIRRDWATRPTGRGKPTPYELYGGDLRGVEEHLDHVESLGANLIYLTPFFPATSSHRYDATTFDHVDPLLGGDDALRSLCAAAHARGIRVIGDITLNHTGYRHEWFERAQADASSPERGFYLFDDTLPHGYESWLGIPHLPKLDWRSAELHRRFAHVIRRYLDLGLDGWRVDVANMVGRYRDIDLNRDVSKWARAQVGDALLIAEHGHDFRPDLGVRGWHGVMNYSGFLRPLWTWLLRDDPHPEQQQQFWGIQVGVPQLGGDAAVQALRRFRAGVPWEAVLNSWNLLDSHDTARFRTITGTPERHLAGVGLQMTLPGVPMVFAGDELGLEGAWGEDARRTMPWGDDWDEEFLDAFRELVRLRRTRPALARGGIRWVHVDPDTLAFLRETRDEQLLCIASRTPIDELPGPFTTLDPLYDSPQFQIWRIHG